MLVLTYFISVSIALSSAEAELTAISEGVKECVGLAALVKHVYRTELEVPVVRLSDSRTAINISTMEGLLRRARRINVRLCWVKDAVKEIKARLEWVSGAQSVADIFTKSNIQKSSYSSHLEMLGFVEKRPPGNGGAANVDWGAEEPSALLGKEPDIPALVELDARFVDLNLDLLTWLVVEYCASPQSNLGCAGSSLKSGRVAVIRITERENGLLGETIALIRGHVERVCRMGVRVLVWSSTPCTGGCLWQFVLRQREGYDQCLKKIWAVQRKLWKGFEVLAQAMTDLPNDCRSPFLAVEWPKTCQYWRWKTTRKTEQNQRRVILTAIDCYCAWLFCWHGWKRCPPC